MVQKHVNEREIFGSMTWGLIILAALPQNTTQKSISIAFCVSAIRHDSSLSKYRKQKQPPPPRLEILKMAHV